MLHGPLWEPGWERGQPRMEPRFRVGAFPLWVWPPSESWIAAHTSSPSATPRPDPPTRGSRPRARIRGAEWGPARGRGSRAGRRGADGQDSARVHCGARAARAGPAGRWWVMLVRLWVLSRCLFGIWRAANHRNAAQIRCKTCRNYQILTECIPDLTPLPIPGRPGVM